MDGGDATEEHLKTHEKLHRKKPSTTVSDTQTKKPRGKESDKVEKKSGSDKKHFTGTAPEIETQRNLRQRRSGAVPKTYAVEKTRTTLATPGPSTSHKAKGKSDTVRHGETSPPVETSAAPGQSRSSKAKGKSDSGQD